MIVRVDKCSTFGIKKAITKSVQYLPKLLINNAVIPAIELGKSFCYLGRYFDYEMTNNEHKLELISLLTNLMKKIDLNPLHPKNKILLYNRYVYRNSPGILLLHQFQKPGFRKTWILYLRNMFANGLRYLFLER